MEYYQYTALLFIGTLAMSMLKDYIDVRYTYRKKEM
jgi:hypothetical protein